LGYRFTAVLFDFDYTLVDSSRGICACFNYALEKMGLPLAQAEDICKTIGIPTPEMLVRVMGEQYRERSEEFRALFREMAEICMNRETTILKDTDSTIRFLKRKGIKLGVVSTKTRARIEEFLTQKGLFEFFDIIIGGGDVSNPKPDPEGILTAVSKLGVGPEACLYVGDSITDALAAQRAGLAFAAVLTGTTRREDFKGYDVMWYMEGLAKLPELVKK